MARVSAPQTQLVAEATESAEAHEAVESELAATSLGPVRRVCDGAVPVGGRVSVIRSHFRASNPIPYLDATVPTSGHHRLTVGRKGNGRDIPGVNHQGVDQLPSPSLAR